MFLFLELTPNQPLSGNIVKAIWGSGEIPSGNRPIIHRTLFITSPDFDLSTKTNALMH